MASDEEADRRFHTRDRTEPWLDGDPAATYDVVVAAVTHAREGPASGIPR